MNELLRAEIVDQPALIYECLPAIREQAANLGVLERTPGRVIFIGSGDSHIAPLALGYAARALIDHPIHVLSALEAARYWTFISSDLVLAISISGEAARTIEAAQLARMSGARVVSISSNPNSTLAREHPNMLTIPFNSRSRKIPHTADYTSTLLAVAIVIERLCGSSINDLENLSSLIEQTIFALETKARGVADELKDKDRFYFVGGGPNFATAMYGAAKFWEASGLLASAFELEEFAHGPHLMLESGDPVFVVAPDGAVLGRAIEIVNGLVALQASVYIVTDAFVFERALTFTIPTINEIWSPFLTCLPLQWLCLSIASAKGYDLLGDRRHAQQEMHRAWVRKPDSD